MSNDFGTTYRTNFRKKELIKAEDFNKNFELIKRGIPFNIDAIRSEIIKNGSIKLEDLSDEILQVLAVVGLNWEQEKFIVNGTTYFNLQFKPIINSETIFLNGIQQQKTEFYNITDSTLNIIYPEDIISGDILTIKYARKLT